MALNDLSVIHDTFRRK